MVLLNFLEKCFCALGVSESNVLEEEVELSHANLLIGIVGGVHTVIGDERICALQYSTVLDGNVELTASLCVAVEEEARAGEGMTVQVDKQVTELEGEVIVGGGKGYVASHEQNNVVCRE